MLSPAFRDIRTDDVCFTGRLCVGSACDMRFRVLPTYSETQVQMAFGESDVASLCFREETDCEVELSGAQFYGLRTNLAFQLSFSYRDIAYSWPLLDCE